ncbi:hypothetical protein BC832DRAFT_289962 [Gaertneriomyces semiglobifer]|nr:hypothetical protein BC832DRAFT_289962 [Gaertneriomyces semiglobifer]
MVGKLRKKRTLEPSALPDRFDEVSTEMQAPRDESGDEDSTDSHIMDLNDDCWTHVLNYVGHTSLPKLRELSVLNRRFHTLVIHHPIWAFIGRRLNLSGPKPKARKYKTWLSLVLTKRGKFCESCFKRCSKPKTFLMGEPALAIATCANCYRTRSIAERQRIVDTRYLAIKEDFGVKEGVATGYGVDIKIFAEQAHRRSRLEEALRKHDLILRSDSKLCNSYGARNEGELEDVVTVMVEMNWFFNHTAYDDLRWFEYFDNDYSSGYDCDYDYDSDYDNDYDYDYGYECYCGHNYNYGCKRQP